FPLTEETRKSLVATRHATSVATDPHKLGYVPKGCGAVLFKRDEFTRFIIQECGYFRNQKAEDEDDSYDFRFHKNQHFQSGVEGSRSGRGPVACYLMHKLFPLHNQGHGKILSASLLKSKQVWSELITTSLGDYRLVPVHQPMSNMFCLMLFRPKIDLK